MINVSKPVQAIQDLSVQEIALISGGGWEGADPGYKERTANMKKCGKMLSKVPQPHVKLVGCVMYLTASLLQLTQ